MEVFFLSLLPVAVIFISLSLTFFLYRNKGDPNLPPGKTGWPIIGETLDFISASRNGVPEKFIKDRMSKHSSEVFKTSLLGQSMAVFCSPKGHKFLFSNENKLVTAWWPHTFDKILLASPEASSATKDSKDMRKLLPGFLKPEALQRYVSVMDSVAKQHLDTEWDNKEELRVLPLSRKYTFSLACRLFLNIDDPILEAKLAEPFSSLCDGLTSIPIDLPGTRFNGAIKAAKFIRKEIISIIKQRKMDLSEKMTTPTQDLLSHMLLTSDENGQLMSEVGIAEKIVGLLIGGHDTSASTITFIMKYLAEFPDVYKEVLKGKAL